MKASVRLELPEPLSLNRAYRTYQGRMLISREGREYKKAVAWIVAASRHRFEKTARLKLEIVVHKSSKRRADLDNCAKLLQDSLADGGLYVDDSQIDDLHIVRGEVRKGDGSAIVTVTEI